MRTTSRLALGLSLALAAALIPATAAGADPLAPPCAQPVSEDDRNAVLYEQVRKQEGVVGAKAGFDLTCVGATYTFTVASVVTDKDGSLRGLGWTTTSADGATTSESPSGTSVDIVFVGDGMPHNYSVDGTTAASYFDKKLEDGLQCVEISLTVEVSGFSYTWPSDPDAPPVCTGGGATSHFR